MDYTALMRTRQPVQPLPSGNEDTDKEARAEYMSRQATYEQALAAVEKADALVNGDTPAGERGQKEVVRSLQRLEALGENRAAAELWPVIESNPVYKRYLDPDGWEADQLAAEKARIAEQIAENTRLQDEIEAAAAETETE